jgi:hypothetical protein
VRATKKGKESPNEQKKPGRFSLVGVRSFPFGAFCQASIGLENIAVPIAL